MSRGRRIALWVAAALVVLGLAVMTVGAAMLGFDFTKLDTAVRVERNDAIEEAFDKIEIDGSATDLRILPSADGVCRVVSCLNESIDYSVAVRDGKLVIRYGSTKWYENMTLFGFGKTYITLYLPAGAYTSLAVDVGAGDVTLSDLQIDSVVCDVGSGDVKAKNLKGKQLRIETISGDVAIDSVKLAESLSVKTISGDIKVEDTLAEENITLLCTSGDIVFSRMDAQTLKIKTTSGDVEGTLLSVKHFVAHATSGDVHISDSDSSAGKCTVNTTSGDIDIRIAK